MRLDGSGGRGRSLTALFIESLRQAFSEMEASRDEEETPLIVALALLIVARLAQGGDPDAAVGDIAQALAADEELSHRAEGAVAVARLRQMLLAAIAAAEAGGRGDAVTDLRDLYSAPGALASACADDRARKELAARLDAGAALGGEAGPSMEQARGALRGWRAREPAACVGLSHEAARGEYALAAGAVACDAALERLIGPGRCALVARTGAEAEGGAEAEWEAGRLYRITARAAARSSGPP